MSLPIFQTALKDISLLQTGWAQQLNPVIENPANQSIILSGLKLVIGANTINHKLGRKMQGWSIVDIDGAATIYRSKPLNDQTLTLTSNAVVTISLEVF